jgi:hypothetical protein
LGLTIAASRILDPEALWNEVVKAKYTLDGLSANLVTKAYPKFSKQLEKLKPEEKLIMILMSLAALWATTPALVEAVPAHVITEIVAMLGKTMLAAAGSPIHWTHIKYLSWIIRKGLKPIFGESVPGLILKALQETIDHGDRQIKRALYLIGASCYTQLYGKTVVKQIVREIDPAAAALPKFLSKPQPFNPLHLNSIIHSMPAMPTLGHHYAPHPSLGHHFGHMSQHMVKLPKDLRRSITSTIYNAVHPFQVIRALCKFPVWSFPTILLLLRQSRGKIASFVLRKLWAYLSKSLVPSIITGRKRQSANEDDDDDDDDD